MKLIDIAGNKYGRLTVIEKAGTAPGGQTLWLCICDCGNKSRVRGILLKSGKTKSCGCWQAESRALTKTIHGLRNSDEYRAWRHMRTRCENAKNPAYADYGGRGIYVCERWLDFSNFYTDMGPRPSSRHSLDRIDVDGGYEPWNCRWATSKQQNRNRRDNVVFEFDGISASLAEHCERMGLKYKTIHRRIVCGADMKTALTVGRLPRKKALAVTLERLATC